MRLSTLAALLALSAVAADLTPEQQQLNVDSFEYAWKTIRDKMWEPMPAGLNWQNVHDELLPKVRAAKTMSEARAAMQAMIARLRLTHFSIFPGDVYDTVAAKESGTGAPRFDFRVIGDEALVVSVERGSPASAAGVRPGWRILTVAGRDTVPLLRKVADSYRTATTRELFLYRALLAAMSGSDGDSVLVEFLDGDGNRRSVNVVLTAPRGAETKFGFLPPQHVWFESKKLGNAGYVRFNLFMDPTRVSAKFGDAVQSCSACDGFIVDLRGNPGGLGAMSMGMSGWFIAAQNQRLGVMKMKDAELKFVAIPHAQPYSGPLVILIDGLTGSTAEIFAAGLKDLGRAHIIGARSAGAALPSMFERLPNGDGFQYAVANYISEGGQPLEGIGVVPDEEVRLTRKALLEGRDPVIDAALAYIEKQKGSTQ
jgi:carboxyl-terminal processing protease